ncbi:6-pyruvoyl trahydropterin synthase family protein [Halorussus sp. AFM4]|uniref:6-pyruvoyl trahydropterin synthase family protein n=1 Tax=Halorussus sp. AFM4 TaxID=3421651 RepID=UPI003EBAAD2D
MAQDLYEEHSFTSEDLSETERTLHVGRERPIRLSTGHRILHHDGKCSRPHGHNYKISVSITGTLTSEGWVIDKGDVTSVLSEWDHRFLVEKGDPLIEAFEASGDGDALIVLDQPPTAEVMGIVLERRLEETLPETVSNVAVEVRETGELAAGEAL